MSVLAGSGKVSVASVQPHSRSTALFMLSSSRMSRPWWKHRFITKARHHLIAWRASTSEAQQGFAALARPSLP